jgi:hypothetical protein
VYACLGSSLIDDVITESPGGGTSYSKKQPVSLQLQADNCS